MKFGTNYINTELGGFFFFGSKGYTVNWFDSPMTISEQYEWQISSGLCHARCRAEHQLLRW